MPALWGKTSLTNSDGQKLSMATTIKSATGARWNFFPPTNELSNRAGCKHLIGNCKK